MRLPVDPFWLIEAAALPVLLYWARNTWFWVDDWDFLAHRNAGNVGDLFRPHTQHWTTLPMLTYRLLWSLFGLRYTPYLVVLLVVHLAVAALLREVMLRAGVRRWLATVAASLFIFFGAGSYDILFAFQVIFVGSLFFGLVQLLLVDHDGPFGKRDVCGIAAGLAAIMCSGVGAAMVFTVGIAAWLRRGWRIALAETAPPAVAYLIWFAAIGSKESSYIARPSVTQIMKFVAVGFGAAVGAVAHLDGLGWLLGVALVGGLALSFKQLGRGLFQRAAGPIALLVGSFVLLFETALARVGVIQVKSVQGLIPNGPDAARLSRYVYLIAAMVLPSIALATEILLRRSRAAAVIVGVLVVGAVGNANGLAHRAANHQFTDATRHAVLAAPYIPLAQELPRSVEPARFGFIGNDVDLGWLIDRSHEGRIPKPHDLSARDLADETLRLALTPSQSPARNCRAIRQPARVVLQRGERITLKRGVAALQYAAPQQAPSRPMNFNSGTFTALAGPLSLRVIPASRQPTQPVVLCT
ncbi:MAG: hypothetical protein M3Q30_27875 [Actinomycetota bacterium]|nr:hypothetical protein [Actinomycetota bacterium]